MKRISLPETAHQIIEALLKDGDIAIDATVGNGHDTQFLARQVGSHGHIYGFDIQQQALNATRKRLSEHLLNDNVTLFHASHAEMQHRIPAECHGIVRAIMFNLGYLPGSDKSVITDAESTIIALTGACRLLARPGILTVLAYPGHTGGDTEMLQVQNWALHLEPTEFRCQIHESSIPKPNAPRLFCIEKTQ